MQSGWCYGLCERTGAKGDFPAQCVYSLPTLQKPAPAVLVSMVIMSRTGQVHFKFNISKHTDRDAQDSDLYRTSLILNRTSLKELE